MLHIDSEYNGLRCDSALSKITGVSRSKIAKLIKSHNILINNSAVEIDYKILTDDIVEIIPETPKHNKPENIAIEYVYSDADVIVLNKHAGIVVHPGAGNEDGTVLNALLHDYPELSELDRAGIVHRLDKDTSGLMMVARNTSAQLSLIQQLKNRSAVRVYRAIVHGDINDSGVIDKRISRDKYYRRKMTVNSDGKTAVTYYKLISKISYTENHVFSYIECKLGTGRTHQIRVHLHDQKNSILGDKVYMNTCYKPYNFAPRQMLHAIKLKFIHPTINNEIEFTSDIPKDMLNMLNLFLFE